MATSAALVVVGLLGAAPAYAADTAITITPAATTANSGVPTTYTLTYSCSNAAGSCANSVVTIPTNTVTGDGSTTDFASWVTTGTCPAVNKSVAGQVSFNFGTLGTSTNTCTFTVLPPEYTTLNNATATITPTLSSSNSTSSTATPATLTATAGHNDSIANSAPAKAISGSPFEYAITFDCGLNPKAYSGDLGLSNLVITSTLPANFDYQSFRLSSAVPGTVSYDPTTRVLTYTDNTGKSCANPPLNVSNLFTIFVAGKAATNGTPDAVGTQICNSASATWTYIDNVPGAGNTTQACSTVIDLATTITKATATPGNLSNIGQFAAADGGASAPYTYPGDWDGTGAGVYYDLSPSTVPAAANAGIAYDIDDPMPCLTNVSNKNYSSNAPGTTCTAPAFVPTQIQPNGFTATAADTITLTYTDGTTGSVAYSTTAGAWVIPTAPAVAEVDIPALADEGSNSAATMRFRMFGYASGSVPTAAVLTNKVVSTPYSAGDTTSPLLASQTATSRLLVVAPPANDAAFIYPGVTMTQVGTTCAANVNLNSGTNGAYSARIEVPTAPSQAIYIDYLAPSGATAVDPATTAFQLKTLNANGAGGTSFTSPTVTPTVTPNYNGTGRTLVRWTIPAGVATAAGYYNIRSTNFVSLTLEAGCAGTYSSDITIGYGAPIAQCFFDNYSSDHVQDAPMFPTADNDLRANGSPIADNYCGYSTSINVAPIKPGFTVDKKVQGNLDPTPIGSGGTGHVSVDGGTATYTVTFTNTGQSTLSDPVMYDLLPRVGDTKASSTEARKSQFPVALTGVGALPAGLAVAYSQATNPCRPEVLTPNAGCVDDWSTTPPSPLSKATALRFTYTGRVLVSTGFSATYAVSTPATAAGNTAWNSVGTNVTSGTALLGAAESSLTGLQAQSAQPAITKTASRSTVDAVGQPIVYTFTVTNNTAVPLANVKVTDALVDSAASSATPTPTCSALTSPAGTCSGVTTTLAPGQSATFTATYVTTQDDLDHGSIADQATAAATPPTGPALSNSTGVVTVTATQNAALTLSKSATPDTVKAVGDNVDYTFAVTNSGNVTLTGLGIDEKSFSGSGSLSTITCPPDALAPGASVDCTASYPVTQADLNAGSIVNTAAATAQSPSGSMATSPDSTATVTVDQTAGLSLVKSASPSAADAYTAGQVISYSYVVTNTGNVPVTGIQVNEVTFTGSDALSAIDCPATSLDPAAQLTCTASYTLTQADVDSGSLTNTATATGTAVTGPVVSDPSTVTTPQTPDSKLTFTKTADTSFVNAAGDVIGYTFAITNAGNVTIHGVDAEETAFSGSGAQPTVTCPTNVLIPGQQVDCTASYTVTQVDMNAGVIVNTAHATGIDTTGADIVSNPWTATVTVNAAPALTLLKTANVASYDAVGDAIDFAFLITNSGNVELHGVGVDEGTFSGSGSLGDVDCATTDLEPGDSVTCHAGYDATQADLDRGSIENTATAVAETGAGAPVASDPSTASVAAVQTPALGLEKTASPTSVNAAGDSVTYSFHLTNEGNVTLSGLAIDESAFSGTGAIATPDCGSGALAPGADVTCTVTYQVTQADVDAGKVTNTAVATANAGAVSSDPSTATVTIDRAAALSLVKSVSSVIPTALKAGQAITYSFVITNTGNVTVSNPAVQEGDFTGSGALSAPACDGSGPLAPGAQLICTADYTVTQADIDAGTISNTATATGGAPDGVTPPTSPASEVTLPEPVKSALAVVKTTDATQLSTVGQTVNYAFKVTNTGNTTETKVAVVEGAFAGHGGKPVVTCPSGSLLPGQIMSCAARYTVVAADLDGESLSNTATAVSVSPSGTKIVSDPSTATIKDVVSTSGSGDPLADTGSNIGWGVISLALGMIGLGAILGFLRRRRRAAE
ncbi:beta strand repeat-containing protein [Humibacter soli]